MITSCSKKFHTGIYSTNFPAYGMFSQSIELKEDSTFVKNFRGDMMNDNSVGTWSVKQDTLVLVFDTIKNPKSRYKGTEIFIIKNKKLIYPDNDWIITKLKSGNIWDTLSNKQKRELKKNISLTPKDFYGTMRKQYYILRDK
ncbi:hypothetical protein ABS768_03210 [Flavobacterium sp. ST-75]|uniref:Uncharacterized protein n=1 Tax=Flavobacterium rhizophilum TaxID=3163296 RepID=A0ABW8Y8G9_9FLAO